MLSQLFLNFEMIQEQLTQCTHLFGVPGVHFENTLMDFDIYQDSFVTQKSIG